MKFTIAVSILALMLAACAPMTTFEIPSTDATIPVDADPLANTQWTLVSFGDVGAEAPVVEGSTVTLEFQEENQAVGSGGCNSFGGTYQVENGTLSFDQIASTLMACADENVMQQEQQYLAALESAGEFELAADQLTIWYNDGQGVLTFAQTSAVTPTQEPGTPGGEAGLAGTQWTLISFGDVGAEMPVVEGSTVTLEFEEGSQAGGNAGCNSFGGTYQVENGTLSFDQIVSTLMACVDENVMQQEQQYLAALQSAAEFELTDAQLTIWYNDGQGVLNFSRAAATPAPTDETPAATPAPVDEASASTPTPVAESTATPTPLGESSTEEATRINFAPGETSAEISATIEERGLDRYVLQAQEGQIMSVEITSPNGDVLLTVVGEDGIPLKRYQVGPPSWTSQLPATQDYFLHAVSVGPATSYTLRVWIEPLSPQTGERVEFEPGATSATRSGALPEGGVKEYVLAAAAGQTMHVQTVGYGAPVHFTIRSPGGATWSGEAQASEVYIFTAQVVLPQDGDYVVTLSVPPEAGATRYDVTFTIDTAALPATPSPSEPPERVEFSPGEISAERSGLLPSGPGIKQYVLAAGEGQTMTVDVTSDGTPLSLTIESPSGNRRIPEMRPIEGGYAIGQQFTLPESGDYVVTLGKADHTPSTNYNVMVTIQ